MSLFRQTRVRRRRNKTIKRAAFMFAYLDLWQRSRSFVEARQFYCLLSPPQ